MRTPYRYSGANWDDIPTAVKELFGKMIGENKFADDDESLEHPLYPDVKEGLFLHGPVGCGKTHIVYGLKKFLDESREGSYFWNVTELLAEIKADFTRDEKKRPVEDFNSESGLDRVLFLDDIGSEKPSEFAIETLYLIVNKRYNEKAKTIFTSNFSLGELADRIGERTASRIAEMCEVVELTGTDRRLQK